MLLQALGRGLLDLFHPRMFALLVLPLVAAALVWVVAVLGFWSVAVAWLQAHLQQWEAAQWLLQTWPLSLVAAHAAALVLVLGLVPVVLVLATLLIGLFAMPVMVRHVAGRDYPALERHMGGSAAGALWQGLKGCLWFALAALITLPLWLLPPLWPCLSLGLLGLLNQQVYPYDALAEHARADELQALLRERGWPLYWLGVAVAAATHVPVLGLFAPVYGGLVYVHYCLGELQRLRGARQQSGFSGRVLEHGGNS